MLFADMFSFLAAAAAFSLICIARFFFLLLAGAETAFKEDNVEEYSFGARTTFDVIIGLLYKRIEKSMMRFKQIGANSVSLEYIPCL